MKILENKTDDNLPLLSLNRFRINLYQVADGRCYPCKDSEALQVARHLKAVNPTFVKLKDGSAYLIADQFPPIQSQIEAGIKDLQEPNGSGFGYEYFEYFSCFVYHPLFWGGIPISIYEDKKFDFRGYKEEDYWVSVVKVCQIF